MKHLQDLTAYWNWLPAFRVVAETEHLPTAAQHLHLTPSALSRSVKLLEEAIGEPLFERRGRRLVLLSAGAHLLDAVRLSMRTVHEGVQTVQTRQYSGPIRIFAPAPLNTTIILPAIKRLLHEQPMLEPSLNAATTSTIQRDLLQGHIDLALADQPCPTKEIVSTRLTSLSHHVHCATDHPLTHVPADELEARIADTPFVAPTMTPDGQTPDAWPSHKPRIISLRVAQMFVALEAVRAGDHIAIFPDIVAKGHGLTRLNHPHHIHTDLFLLHRPYITTTRPCRTELLAKHIRAVLEDLNH